MLAQIIMRFHRAILLTVLTVALVATGFGHRMPSANDQALAFALANGVAPGDFCGDGLPGTPQADTNCLACHILGGADLPPVTGGLQDLDLVFVAKVTAPRESLLVARVLDPSRAPQGPPVA